MTTWILPGQLIDGTGAPPRHDAAVRIDDGRIAAVLTRAEAEPAAGDSVVDEPDLVLTPGLVDSHVHLIFDHGPDHATTRARVERASDDELALLAARNAQMCLVAGITTVRDCGGRGLVTCRIRDAIAAGDLVGPRVLAAGPPITTTAGHLHWCGLVADTRDELRRAVRGLCRDGVDFVKVMATGGNMTAGSNPLRPQYDADELALVVADSHRLERRVAAHVLNAETLPWAVAAGVDTLEHCLWSAPGGRSAYDPELAERIAAGPSWVGVTHAGIDRRLLPDAGGDEEGLASLRARHADTRRLLRAGARVMISSDAGVRYTRFEDFALSLACAVEALDMTPLEAIHRATEVPADALGLADEIGTVTVGKRADLLLVDGDPAKRVADMGAVRGVWRDGRPVVVDGRVAAPDSRPLVVADTGAPA